MKRNCYYRMSRCLTSLPNNIIILVIAFGLLASACIPIASLNLALGANIDFGTDKAGKAYANAIAQFPGVFGGDFTVEVTVAGEEESEIRSETSKKNIFTENLFDIVYGIADGIEQNVSNVVTQSVLSIASYQDIQINLQVAESYLSDSSDDFLPAIYQRTWKELVNPSNQSTLIKFAPDFNPFSSRSRDLIFEVREVLYTISKKYKSVVSREVEFSNQFSKFSFYAPQSGSTVSSNRTIYSIYFYHPIVVELDAETFTFQRFPWVFGVTLLLTFALIAIRFRAAIIPIKLVMTILLPIAAVYGLAVLVYQTGILNFLHFRALSDSGVNGISWLLPCSTIFLLVGLALDYDLFLFSRVFELRQTHSDRESIAKAVEVTGPVISGAGIIMALAFLGMLANSNRFLNEFGFVMILGVLLDTFVVRTILVPAVLSIGGCANWWPGRMPFIEDNEGEDAVYDNSLA